MPTHPASTASTAVSFLTGLRYLFFYAVVFGSSAARLEYHWLIPSPSTGIFIFYLESSHPLRHLERTRLVPPPPIRIKNEPVQALHPLAADSPPSTPSASRIRSILANLLVPNGTHPRPDKLGSWEDPSKAEDLARAFHSRSIDAIAECVRRLDPPRLLFLGDSVMRRQFNHLMDLMSEKHVDSANVPHADQEHVAEFPGGGELRFRFVVNMTQAPALLAAQPKPGGMIFNVGLWELKPFPEDMSFMVRYMAEMAKIALAFGETGAAPERRVWIDTAPVMEKNIGSDRHGIRTVRIAALNEVASGMLGSVGFQRVPTWALFGSDVENPRSYDSDGMHPSPATIKRIVQAALDRVCGERLDRWDEAGLKEMASYGVAMEIFAYNTEMENVTSTTVDEVAAATP
ncbi:hypothetical protein HK101_003137 [Irineochytrium annulatum]|nr:hypothetical protein HK101_003137 [Irineochytrium annulatum]